MPVEINPDLPEYQRPAWTNGSDKINWWDLRTSPDPHSRRTEESEETSESSDHESDQATS